MFSASRTAARGDLVPSAVLGLLGTRGPTSRADVARVLGVSPATVTQVTRELIGNGLVRELEQVPSQGGRPARLLGLVSTEVGAIGAKVTADHVAMVHVGLDGSVRSATVQAYDPDAPDAVRRLAALLAAEVDVHQGRLLGIGVGIPGAVDAQASGVVDAHTLGWSGVRVGDVLRAETGVPVLVENDVNTLAVAQTLYGSGHQSATYLVITIGRGIGCGLVVDGSVYRGAAGGAGEIGHLPVEIDGPACTCGNRGCLEAVIGDDGLLRAAVDAGLDGLDDGPAGLARAADDGDTRAQEVYRAAGELLGRTLAGVVHLVDPEQVVISGEGIGAWRHWRPGFEEALRGHLIPARRGLPVAVEPWSEDRWAVGAAALVLATPFDSVGTAGRQGELVRERLQHTPAPTKEEATP